MDNKSYNPKPSPRDFARTCFLEGEEIETLSGMRVTLLDHQSRTVSSHVVINRSRWMLPENILLRYVDRLMISYPDHRFEIMNLFLVGLKERQSPNEIMDKIVGYINSEIIDG